MSAIAAPITVSDELTPLLAALQSSTKELRRSNKMIAARVADGVRAHISRAAVTRHKTARALGVLPTGYLDRRAQSISIDESGDSLNIAIDGAPEMFARVRGDVLVLPTNGRKYLTIPVDAAVHTKRAREIPDLKIKEGINPLNGKKGLFLWGAYRGEMRPLYQLIKRAFLPRDEGLLPSNADIVKLLEQGAIDVIQYETELAQGASRDALARTVIRPEDNTYRGRPAPL